MRLRVVVPPDQAYGERNSDLVRVVALEEFSELGEELQVGMQHPPCHCPRCTAVREGRSPMPGTAKEVGRAQ